MITHSNFTSETYAALSPEWQAVARRLLKEQGELLAEANDCSDEDEASTLLDRAAAVSEKLDGLTRLLIN